MYVCMYVLLLFFSSSQSQSARAFRCIAAASAMTSQGCSDVMPPLLTHPFGTDSPPSARQSQQPWSSLHTEHTCVLIEQTLCGSYLYSATVSRYSFSARKNNYSQKKTFWSLWNFDIDSASLRSLIGFDMYCIYM